MIPVPDYLQFVDNQYFSTFLKNGGTTVKFCVAEDEDQTSFKSQLIDMAEQSNYFVAQLDASTTKIQMIEQIFFEVAKKIDWRVLAANACKTACESAGYAIPNDIESPSIETLARYYDTDLRELQRDVQKRLQKEIYRDYNMIQEFRIAMLRLCQFELATGQVSDAEFDSLNQWLQGSLPQISLLKSARIFRKISRNNARQMLFSLTHWLVKNGYSGVILVLDLRQFFRSRQIVDGSNLPNFYTRAAILDAYESIRQLIDNADEFANMATFVCVPPEFISDRSRGIDLYQALKLRIYDEVRDQRRDNPFGTLIRLGSTDSNEISKQDEFTAIGSSIGNL